jgi:phage gp36-like protein
MPYSEIDDLNLSDQRLIELTDSEDAVNELDDELLDRLQLRATSKVDAALYGKYTIDPEDFPPILTQIEADLWRYYLYEHREVMEIPKTVQAAFDASIELLEKYRTGMEPLGAAHVNAATAPGYAGGSLSSDSDDRVFERAKDGL